MHQGFLFLSALSHWWCRAWHVYFVPSCTCPRGKAGAHVSNARHEDSMTRKSAIRVPLKPGRGRSRVSNGFPHDLNNTLLSESAALAQQNDVPWQARWSIDERTPSPDDSRSPEILEINAPLGEYELVDQQHGLNSDAAASDGLQSGAENASELDVEDADTAVRANDQFNVTTNEFLQLLPSALRRRFTCEWIVGVLAVTGPSRMSVEQYNFLRLIMNWIVHTTSRDDAFPVYSSTITGRLLPSYSTLYRTALPVLTRNGFPEYEYVNVQRNTDNKPHLGASCRIIVLQPSTWAKCDICFKPLYNLLRKCASEPSY